MKSSLALKVSWLLAFFSVLLWLSLMAKPLRAEEPSVGESIAEKTQPEKAEPPEAPAGFGFGIDRERLGLIADFEACFILSDLKGSDLLWGGSLDGVIVPNYRINDNNILMLMYEGTYYKKRDFYSEDVYLYSDVEGPIERTEHQRHSLTPMFRMDFGSRSRYSITPSFFYTKTLNKDIESSNWSGGLYNYDDIGVGLDWKLKGPGSGEADSNLRLGAQYYKRRYPNYESLLDTAMGIGTEKDEKDYHGVIGRVGYERIKESGFLWSADYSLLFKMLDDKKVVDADGFLTSEEQRDYVHSLDLRFSYVLVDLLGELELGLGLRGGLNRSNQNYYDGMGTPELTDDIFTYNFYNYNSYRICPNISFTFASCPMTFTLVYLYGKTDYTQRLAKSSDGAYKDEKQYETLRGVDIGLTYVLTEQWSLLARFEHITARSNNDYERVYQYDYEVTNYSIGASFRY